MWVVTDKIKQDSYFLRWVEFNEYYIHYNEQINEYYLVNTHVGACLFTLEKTVEMIKNSVKPLEEVHFSKVI